MATPRTKVRTPQLIGEKPCSREYSVKYTSLRAIVHRGELPGIRIGRATYVDRVDVERWIESSKERG
jgi:helix-turn-helix protein